MTTTSISACISHRSLNSLTLRVTYTSDVLVKLGLSELLRWLVIDAKLFAPQEGANMSVCLFCHITQKPWLNFTNFCACCLWPLFGPICSMPGTSRFVDDVISSHNGTVARRVYS